MFLEAWEALEDPKRGESNNRDPSLHLNSPWDGFPPHTPVFSPVYLAVGRESWGGISAEQEFRRAFS